jgi:hypothetical protein
LTPTLWGGIIVEGRELAQTTNEGLIMSSENVSAIVVNNCKRLNLLRELFGPYYLMFESTVHSDMSEWSRLDFNNLSCWEFYSIDSKTIFLVPNTHQHYKMTNDKYYYNDTLSAYSAGLMISIIAVEKLMWGVVGDWQEDLLEKYFSLIRYAEKQKESDKILKIFKN